jgi:hypothetical protein
VKTYKAKERKESATVVVNGKPKYPIKDEAHAELALKLINSAKPALTSDQKTKVRRKAARFGATSSKKGKA